jgi:hypothetical protein
MDTVDVADCKSGRVIHFEIAAKKTKLSEGIFDGVSKGVEIARFNELLSRRFHDSNVG